MRSLITLVCVLMAGTFVMAAPQPTGPATAAQPAAGKKAQKEMNFEELLVQGKYHFSDEAVTTVEEDKVLDGLIGVRTDFKDRVRQSAAQQ